MLKSLELFGFKSFAERLRFDFGAGVTGIVGPNGSGKSNVVDALKWVLGEQSAKGLRGKEMTDVVFNGAGGRKPMGMAEVSLVFDNSQGSLPIPAPEVTLTRRVYRDGQSEYLVNGQAARLRDFKDLFLGTGAGLGAYSIIEQGRVEQLLSASPQERRHLFEEAAGVSRYKAKRIEALRRLDRVEQNLLRARDLRDEHEKQAKTLRTQAAKARTHQDLAARLKELRLAVGRHEGHAARTELAALVAAGAEAQARRTAAETEIAAVRQAHEAFEADRAERERDELRKANDRAVLRARRDGVANDLRAEERRAAELALERGRRRDASARARQQAWEHGQLALRAEAELAAGTAAAAARAAAHQTAQTQRQGLLAAVAPLAPQLDTLRRAAAAAAATLARGEADARALALRVEELRAQRRRAADRAAEAARQRQLAAARLAPLLRQRQAVRAELARGQENAGALQHERRARAAARQELLRALGDARERRTAAAARIDTLEQLRQRREGLDDGVQMALQRRAQDQPAWRPVLGLLAEFLVVDAARADLVELALGPLAQALLVRSADDLTPELVAAAAALPGRVRFLPLDERATDRLVVFPDELGASLADLVDCDASLRPLVDRLLAATLLVPDFAVAKAFAARTAELRFVTPAGELLEADGTLSAGPARAASGLLARHAEFRDLGKQIEALDAVVSARAAELSALEAVLAGLEDRLSAQASREGVLAAQERRLDAAVRAGAVRLRAHERESAAALADGAQAGAALAELEHSFAALQTGLAADRAKAAAAPQAIAALEAEASAHQARLRAEEKAAAESALALAVAEERVAALTQRQRQAGLELQTRLRDAERETARADEIAAQTREAEARLLDLRAAHAEAAWRWEQFAAVPPSAPALALAARTPAPNYRQRLDALHAEREQHAATAHRAELRLTELRLATANAAGRLREDYGVDYDALPAPDPAVAFDPAAAAAELETLRGQLQKLGAVNLQALEQLHEAEGRLHALDLQLRDLDEAERRLREIVAEVNAECRRLLAETFAAVRGHFQELFRRLFGGGRADLSLEDNGDILDAGVEIVARPPGKEPRSLSLLSGGEKTLTAAALLLALFRSKPSPFCVLDEVDAALDESNIGRFVEVLRDFLADTQFILITHSKTTMASADVLHGVTQRESGVSIRVSIALDDIAEDGSLRTAPLALPKAA